MDYSKKPTIIFVLICIWIISPIFINPVYINARKDDYSNFQESEFEQEQHDTKSTLKWMELSSKADQNNNGIGDIFEVRLKELSEFGYIDEDKRDSNGKNVNDDIFGIKTQKTEEITLDDIPIIISFPEQDYDLSLSLYEELGGIVKSTYKSAINGFAGRISHDALNEFCLLLKNNNIRFLIEEDRICEAQLYYAGRNMNLRPYVWNTLSYDGDDYSSIAIIDTGLDDSHNFFPLGYSSGDPSSKIIGWMDLINGNSDPYDDNGHGTHCSGIATGEGGPNYDHLGRSVATTWDFHALDGDTFEGNYSFNWARFNVTDPGTIDIEIEFDDFTTGSDDVDLWVYLSYGDTMVDYYEPSSDSWTHNLSYPVTSGELGMYSFKFSANYIDNTGDGWVDFVDVQFRSKIHWPFDPPRFGSGDLWKGVAPDAHLVGVKVLNQYGSGWSSDIINGINWVISNRMVYNITTISLSLGSEPGFVAMIDAVNNAVENGIVTVVAAGNEGPEFNYIGSPGDADNVITVAASNVHDNITSYSSQGGSSYTGNTIKPDITAPGGSFFDLQMFSADTNDNDGYGGYTPDWYEDDLFGAQGTSMSTPAVAGAANLLIEAMGGHESWGYTGLEAKNVKSLLLMSATETYPLQREYFGELYSPELNRGGKDVHEGYGRLNIDIAIEAYTQELILGSQTNAWITSSSDNSFNKHGFGCYVNINSGDDYIFSLDVPDGADFDLYLYSDTSTSTGEPQMVASSTSPEEGTDEFIYYTAVETSKYYLIAKAISGEGNAVISYTILDYDLHVTLEVPISPDVGNTYIVNATVTNTGNNIESNVDLFLYLDGGVVNSTTILSLPIDASKTINYTWTPTEHETYNFTAYSPPVPSETFLLNNRITGLILIRRTIFFEDFERGLSKWETITGLWHLTDDTSIWPDPYHSPTHSMWFGNEPTGDYDTGYREMGDLISKPIDLSPFDELILEYYHWREAEGDGWDISLVYISTDGIKWDLLYLSGTAYIPPWEKVSLDISRYAGNPSVQLKFSFDTLNSDKINNYRGWLVDDVEILGQGIYDHDLSVSLEAPKFPDIDNTYIINATVTNTGKEDESNVDFFLYLESVVVNSTTISSLPVGLSETLNYTWIPTEYKKYNFTVNALSVPGEPLIINNIITKLVPVREVTLFDDMFIDYNYTSYGGFMPAEVTYSYVTEDVFHVDWYLNSKYHMYWDVNAKTRIMENSFSPFGDGYHSPMWIFYDISLGDQILIAVDDEGDHIFNVSSETTIDLPYFGTKDVWVLEDLTFPGGIAWYEKDTGILLNGTFSRDMGRFYNYKFEFLFTNVFGFDHDLSVSLEEPDSPGLGETYIINATVSNTGNNTEYNVNFYLYLDGVVVNSTIISNLPIGVSETINYIWIPTEYKTYNFTADALPVLGEIYFRNNIATKKIPIPKNYTMIPGALYSWIDPSGGTELFLWDDDYAAINLPFDFEFYGETFSSVYLSANGYLSFTDPMPWDFFNIPFPSVNPKHNYMIAPFWDDLDPRQGGNIYVQSFGTYWVAEWSSIYNIGGNRIGTFEVILYETGEIVFNYDFLRYTSGGYTCGLNLGVNTRYYNSYQGLNVLTNDFSILLFAHGAPPRPFELKSNTGTPVDDDGGFTLTWDYSLGTSSYSVYQYSSLITEINGSLTLLLAGSTDLSLPLSEYTNGIYYFIVVAINDFGETISNCIKVVVAIPPEEEEQKGSGRIPGYSLFILIMFIAVVSIIILKKRYTHMKDT